jgi:hypothetical protein
MCHLQTERHGRFGRDVVRSLFHRRPQPVPCASRRDLPHLPADLRSPRGTFCFVTAGPRVFPAQQPSTGSVCILCRQDAVGHTGCLQRFSRAHEGHVTGLYSSRHSGVVRRRVVLTGTRCHVLRQPEAGLHRLEFVSVRIHHTHGRRVSQLDAEQTDCEIPMTPNHARGCVKSAESNFVNDQIFDLTHFDEVGRCFRWSPNDFSHILALQRTRPSPSGCHPRLPRAGSLSLGVRPLRTPPMQSRLLCPRRRCA